jgi:N-carbamoyl-L-amino-acid hydrolase
MMATVTTTVAAKSDKRPKSLSKADPASRFSEFPNININRLWNDIQSTAQWGQIPNSPGLSRLALSEDDQRVREWFCHEAQKLGCDIKVDLMGNIFAILPGTVPGLSPIGMGSHLDSQPSGRFHPGVKIER